MVKKLDLLESDHGCGPNGYPGKAIQNGSITTLHGQQLTCNVFLAAVRRVGTSPMDSARSSIFALRGSANAGASPKGDLRMRTTGRQPSSRMSGLLDSLQPTPSADVLPPKGRMSFLAIRPPRPITFTPKGLQPAGSGSFLHMSVVKPHFRHQSAEAGIGTKRIELWFDLEVNELG